MKREKSVTIDWMQFQPATFPLRVSASLYMTGGKFSQTVSLQQFPLK